MTNIINVLHDYCCRTLVQRGTPGVQNLQNLRIFLLCVASFYVFLAIGSGLPDLKWRNILKGFSGRHRVDQFCFKFLNGAICVPHFVILIVNFLRCRTFWKMRSRAIYRARRRCRILRATSGRPCSRTASKNWTRRRRTRRSARKRRGRRCPMSRIPRWRSRRPERWDVYETFRD